MPIQPSSFPEGKSFITFNAGTCPAQISDPIIRLLYFRKGNRNIQGRPSLMRPVPIEMDPKSTGSIQIFFAYIREIMNVLKIKQVV